MNNNFPYNAPIIAEKVVCPPAGTTVTWDTTKYDYESFLVDNLGTEEVTVYLYSSLVAFTFFVVPVGTYQCVEQDEIIKVVISPAGGGSIINYTFQGYKKAGV